MNTGRAKIQWYSENYRFKEINRIDDGQPMEFEWKFCAGLTTMRILKQIQSMMTETKCEPEHFKDRINFMSMYNDIEWDRRGTKDRCEHNSQMIANCARRFPRGHWSFLGPGSEKKWYGTCNEKLDGSWDRIAERMMTEFPRIWSSNIPWFQCHRERRIEKQRRRKEVNTLQQYRY